MTRDSGGATLPWSGKAIGLLDLDAFFASVEQLDHPDWRGKPVIVGGSADRRGVVSTASYEARRFGVHSAMPSWQAERLCPNAIWTRGHYDRYRELSHEVMSLILDETPLVEQVSIDEAFFDVTPGRYSRESPIAICRRLQRRVAGLGITCSIGLGINKTVAKIASERQKPRGMTVVLPGTEAQFLAPLPVGAMSGVGTATEARLRDMGIRTLGDLARQDEDRMRRAFGIQGPRLVERAAGREVSAVRAEAAPAEVKSVSNERTFAHDLSSEEDVTAAIRMVSSLVGTRLRRKGLRGQQVTLKLRFSLKKTRTAQRQLDGPTDDEHVFGEAAVELLSGIWQPGTPVRLVGVAVSGFGPARPHQQRLELFSPDAGEKDAATGADAAKPRRDLRALSVAADEVRARFGRDALSMGRDLRIGRDASDTSPMNKPDES
ncbi:MAG: DNA polymerase IV [Parafannyhessea sp.]|uniref:DNA polymerase IV n=1 Tax=Parafannyhessea sp. TaxID=2847324 RepID=UPI003F111EA4